ncbi:MAG: nuclear transport factor 2 family protein, partial [Polyangiales bacterium]
MVQPSLRKASSSDDREAILRAAKASPELAGQHDKERWLALYADDAILEDPVGTPASHKGRRPGRLGDELGRFYEAFIAASGIEMVVRQDIVSGMHVFRAVDIHTTNLKTGLKMTVPANLLYEIVPRDGGWVASVTSWAGSTRHSSRQAESKWSYATTSSPECMFFARSTSIRPP